MFAEINVEGFWKAKAAEGNALNTLARHSPQKNLECGRGLRVTEGTNL